MKAEELGQFDYDKAEKTAMAAFEKIAGMVGQSSSYEGDGHMAAGAGELLKGIAALRAQRLAELEALNTRRPAGKPL